MSDRLVYLLITPNRVAAFSSCARREKFIQRFARMFPCMVEPEGPNCWKTGPNISGWEVINAPVRTRRVRAQKVGGSA